MVVPRGLVFCLRLCLGPPPVSTTERFGDRSVRAELGISQRTEGAENGVFLESLAI